MPKPTKPLIVVGVKTSGDVERKEIAATDPRGAIMLFNDASAAEDFIAVTLLRPAIRGAYQVWRTFSRG